MNRIFTLLVCTLFAAAVMAQHGEMRFAGKSKFGVEAMGAWQDNEHDTIIFKLNSMSDADITLPAMTYKAMGVTIPSFTIHGAKFTFDPETRNSKFDDQTYSETITVGGKEKAITGRSLTAVYNHAEKTFEITTKLSYGRMPFPVTYKISAAYVKPDVSDNISVPTVSEDKGIHDLFGRKVTAMQKGQIYIVNGKKIVAK